MNTRRFEDLFYRFSLRPSLFICERFFLRSDEFARFSNTFCGAFNRFFIAHLVLFMAV